MGGRRGRGERVREGEAMGRKEERGGERRRGEKEGKRRRGEEEGRGEGGRGNNVI